MMNDLLEWYNLSRKITNQETLTSEQFECELLALKENPTLLINSLAANLPIGKSLLKLMKPSTNQNSPLSSPVMEDFDPHSDSSDSDEVKYAEDFAEANNNCETSANIDDGTSDSSRDSTTNPGQFWKSLTKNNGKPKEAPEIVLCFWCKRVCEGKNQSEGESGQGGFPLTNGDRHFCSEICFTQCRRASFKKSKICDWCRHVRSTVSYVDFNDGNHQLQFCSDKCLNQYKMHIFCRETEAHLQLHPHLNDLNMSKDGTLITPDLWLKNCDETTQPKNNPKELPKEVEDDYSDEETKETEVIDKSHVSSSSSVGDTSPVSFFDDAEPVNLSTTESKRSPLRPRSCRGAEDYRTRLATRYGRPPKHSSAESGFYGKSKSFKSSYSRDAFEMKPKGTIRVRQLEEQPRLDVPSCVSPSSSAATGLPGFTAFGGLLLGSRPPLLSNIPNLLPPPPPNDIPRPQILPQLLLSHPDLLRFQGLRAPFMLPQPPIQPSQQPPSLPPPPPIPTQPLPPLHTNTPNPMGFPPVTVLLPLPLPIPIPIPIPIPFPFPVKDLERFTKMSRDHQESERSANLVQESPKKDKKVESSESSSGKRKGSCDLSVPPPPLIRPNTSRIMGDFEHSFVKESTSEPLPQDPKGERKERRSILRYTSDVYEVNGVFVPRGGGWDALPATSTSNSKKNDEIVSPISYETTASTSTKPKESPTSLPEETRPSSGSRKRSSESEYNQPVPKKKHLLT